VSGDWQLRAADPEDLPQIVDVIRAESVAFLGRASIDLARVREQLDADPDFDYGRDQLVAERDGEVIAVAVINPQATNISVHPDYELPGLRPALLAWTETRQRELGRLPFRAGVSPSIPAQVALLKASGYRLERFYSEMVCTFATAGSPEPPKLGTGYKLRAMDRGRDLRDLHDLDELAFANEPGSLPMKLEEFNGRYLAVQDFEPRWSFVVEHEEDRLVGLLIGHRPPHRSHGHVAILAVHPDHRRTGLGRALLLTALRSIQAAGLETAGLDVASDNPRALALYTSVGMTEVERYEHHVRTPESGCASG